MDESVHDDGDWVELVRLSASEALVAQGYLESFGLVVVERKAMCNALSQLQDPEGSGAVTLWVPRGQEAEARRLLGDRA